MEFCPKCGSILAPKDGKKIGCVRCSYSAKSKDQVKLPGNC